jgi:hypothetical protein
MRHKFNRPESVPTKKTHVEPAVFHDYEHIVEYSYNVKSNCFVIRFLDGSSYALKTADLPKKMQTKKPNWETAILNENKSGLVVQAGSDFRLIAAHVIHARGHAL